MANLTEINIVSKTDPQRGAAMFRQFQREQRTAWARTAQRHRQAISHSKQYPCPNWDGLTKSEYMAVVTRLRELESLVSRQKSDLARKGEAIRGLEVDNRTLRNRLQQSTISAVDELTG